MTESVLSKLREADRKLQNSTHFYTPINMGTDHRNQPVSGLTSYENKKEFPLIEKKFYAEQLGSSVMPVAQVTDKDIEILKQKENLDRLNRLDNWVGNYFNPEASPANKALLEKVYPQFIEKQKEAISNWYDLKQKWQNIQITGPKNVDDLILMWKMTPETEGYDDNLYKYLKNEPTFRRQNHVSEESRRQEFIKGVRNQNYRERAARFRNQYPDVFS